MLFAAFIACVSAHVSKCLGIDLGSHIPKLTLTPTLFLPDTYRAILAAYDTALLQVMQQEEKDRQEKRQRRLSAGAAVKAAAAAAAAAADTIAADTIAADTIAADTIAADTIAAAAADTAADGVTTAVIHEAADTDAE